MTTVAINLNLIAAVLGILVYLVTDSYHVGRLVLACTALALVQVFGLILVGQR